MALDMGTVRADDGCMTTTESTAALWAAHGLDCPNRAADAFLCVCGCDLPASDAA